MYDRHKTKKDNNSYCYFSLWLVTFLQIGFIGKSDLKQLQMLTEKNLLPHATPLLVLLLSCFQNIVFVTPAARRGGVCIQAAVPSTFLPLELTPPLYQTQVMSAHMIQPTECCIISMDNRWNSSSKKLPLLLNSRCVNFKKFSIKVMKTGENIYFNAKKKGGYLAKEWKYHYFRSFFYFWIIKLSSDQTLTMSKSSLTLPSPSLCNKRCT